MYAELLEGKGKNMVISRARLAAESINHSTYRSWYETYRQNVIAEQRRSCGKKLPLVSSHLAGGFLFAREGSGYLSEAFAFEGREHSFTEDLFRSSPRDFYLDQFATSMKRRLHSLGLERYLDCFVFRDYKERSPLDRKPLRAIALTDKSEHPSGKWLMSEEAILEHLAPFIVQDRDPMQRRIAICSLFFYPVSPGETPAWPLERSQEEAEIAEVAASALSQRLDKIFIEGNLFPELADALAKHPLVIKSILQERTILLEWRLQDQLIRILENRDIKASRAYEQKDIPTIREAPPPVLDWVDGYLPPAEEDKKTVRFNRAMRHAFDLILGKKWFDFDLAKSEPLRILSLGCGICPEAEGVIAYFEEKLGIGRVHFFGLDFREDFIREARRTWDNRPACFIQGDAIRPDVMSQLPPRIDILILRRPDLRTNWHPENPDWKKVLEMAVRKMHRRSCLFATTLLPHEAYVLSQILAEINMPPALMLSNPWCYIGRKEDPELGVETWTLLEQHCLLAGHTLSNRIGLARMHARLRASEETLDLF